VGYDPAVHIVATIYVVGVVIGLLKVDAAPGTKLVLSLLWPIGAVAAVVTIAILLGAAVFLLV
jgi:hypothetical protein